MILKYSSFDFSFINPFYISFNDYNNKVFNYVWSFYLNYFNESIKVYFIILYLKMIFILLSLGISIFDNISYSSNFNSYYFLYLTYKLKSSISNILNNIPISYKISHAF
jgi:hypothetical protein